MAMRGDWQLREACVCVRHRHPLVELWRAEKLVDRYDIATRLSEIEPDILSGTLDRPPVIPSAYDLWLDDRLEDGREEAAPVRRDDLLPAPRARSSSGSSS
jgi:hypothetical protein